MSATTSHPHRIIILLECSVARGGGGEGEGEAARCRSRIAIARVILNEINKRQFKGRQWPMKFSAGDKPYSLFREIRKRPESFLSAVRERIDRFDRAFD